jgi:hypothetical protein
MNNTNKVSQTAFAIMIRSACYGVIVSTGVFAIGLAAVAVLKGYALADWYALTFPRFRGSTESVEIPRVLTVLFIGYVGVAAQLAIIHRRNTVRRIRERQ